MIKTAVVAVLALTLLGLGQAPEANRPQGLKPHVVPEAYGVYAALIPEVLRSKGDRRPVIQDETQAAPFFSSVRDCLPFYDRLLYRDVIEDFDRVNQAPKLLVEGRLRLIQSHELVKRATITQIFHGGVEKGWREFYERFPMSRGYSLVSAVGFNSDKTQALVYFGHHCGGLCGFGRFYLLEKKDGKWQVAPIVGCRWNS